MVDPINFTNYNRNTNELQETILFSLLVAGKNALTTAKQLDNFLEDHKQIGKCPFDRFYIYPITVLPQSLKKYGFGCYNTKAKGIYDLVRAGLDLRTCSVEDLEKIHSIGMKTSRLFVLHTRENAENIPLDVHILHYLADLGYSVPRVTPSSKKKYLEIEKLCIQLAKKAGKTCAEWDLNTWRIYRERAAKKAS